MIRTTHARSLALAIAAMLAGRPAIILAQGMNPQAPSEAMSVDERRTVEIRGNLAALKGAIGVHPDQVEAWRAFEATVNRIDGETRGFTQTFCTLSAIRDQATNPAVAAHRASALGELLTERGRSLERLSTATAQMHDRLDPDQARRYDVMAGQLFRTLIVPPYSSPQTGLPTLCAEGMPNGFIRRPMPAPVNPGPARTPNPLHSIPL